ncbi:MAG: hypothetical protein IJ523_03925 [Succinivibrionaceae bacterium]|nr:hypothetical protein [Succinivibrionaceae bacterium]
MHKGFEQPAQEKEKPRRSGGLNCEKSRVRPDAGKKNIVFLDIDGVLQPYGSQLRFEHSKELTMEMLRNKYPRELVDEGENYDILAAYYDWDEDALDSVARLCRRNGARIVLHSSWIDCSSVERLRLFFELHGMGDCVLDACRSHFREPDRDSFYERKARQYGLGGIEKEKQVIILDWLEEHAGQVQNYVVIDDSDLSWAFGSRFVSSYNVFSDMDCRLAQSVLDGKIGCRQYDDETICIGETFLRYRIEKTGTRKAIFFTTEYTEHLRRRVGFDQWTENIRKLVMILKNRYFCRLRQEEYRDIDFLCWCWPRNYGSKQNLSSAEYADIVDAVNLGYTVGADTEKMYLMARKAGTAKAREHYGGFNRETTEERDACAAGERLVEDFGSKRIQTR